MKIVLKLGQGDLLMFSTKGKTTLCVRVLLRDNMTILI